MERGDDMRSLDEIFRDAQPSISFAPVNETPKPSGQVLGRDFYYDSAGRTIVGDTVTDQMGGGANAPVEPACPPPGAPSSVNVHIEGQRTFSVCEGAGQARATVDHAEDFDISDLEGPDESSCCSKIFSDQGGLFPITVASHSGSTACCTDLGDPFTFADVTFIIRFCLDGTARIEMDAHPPVICGVLPPSWAVSEGTDFEEYPSEKIYFNNLGFGDFIRVTLTFS